MMYSRCDIGCWCETSPFEAITSTIMTDLGDFVYTPILSSVFDQYVQLGLGLGLGLE